MVCDGVSQCGGVRCCYVLAAPCVLHLSVSVIAAAVLLLSSDYYLGFFFRRWPTFVWFSFVLLCSIAAVHYRCERACVFCTQIASLRGYWQTMMPSLSANIPACLPDCPPASAAPCVYPSALPACLSLPVCLHACLAACLPMSLFACLSVCLLCLLAPVCPSVYPAWQSCSSSICLPLSLSPSLTFYLPSSLSVSSLSFCCFCPCLLSHARRILQSSISHCTQAVLMYRFILCFLEMFSDFGALLAKFNPPI